MQRPNILLITSDQQHFSTLGITNPLIKTPALDRLAREGARFERAYCCNPVCSPSRASIITGLYPAWHHCWTIGVKLPEDVPTVGDAFRTHGYRSILIGKAHFQPLVSTPGDESLEAMPKLRDLQFWKNFHGPWYGFDHVETARMHAHEAWVGQHYALWLEEKGLKNWADFFQKYPPKNNRYEDPQYVCGTTWDLPEELHHSHWVAERTVSQMEQCVQKKQPFFLWASFFDPHPPYVIPEPWASMYQPEKMPLDPHTPGEFDDMPPHFRKTMEANPDFSMYAEPGGHVLHGFHSHLHRTEELQRSLACYYGMTSLVDHGLGKILAGLDRLGIVENTLVVFTTDHGHFIGQHGLTAKGPFHYEDLLKLPFLVRYPGKVKANSVSSALQSLVDLSPTFLAAAGLPIPGLMQGVNQLDVWRGQSEQARDHVLIENRHNPTKVHLRTYINKRYKITVYRDAECGELFDLEEDPDEVKNCWEDPAYFQIKQKLLHQFIQAELIREPTRQPRIAGA